MHAHAWSNEFRSHISLRGSCCLVVKASAHAHTHAQCEFSEWCGVSETNNKQTGNRKMPSPSQLCHLRDGVLVFWAGICSAKHIRSGAHYRNNAFAFISTVEKFQICQSICWCWNIALNKCRSSVWLTEATAHNDDVSYFVNGIFIENGKWTIATLRACSSRRDWS